MHIPPGFTQVFPYLFVSDAAAYIGFLITGLDGTEVGRTETPDGTIANVQIRFGDTTIMISEASEAYPPSRSAMYLYVEDAEHSMKQAVSAGAVQEMEVADMSYGDRQGGVKDPAGNIWWITERLEPGPYHPA
jgi:PhnB protein